MVTSRSIPVSPGEVASSRTSLVASKPCVPRQRPVSARVHTRTLSPQSQQLVLRRPASATVTHSIPGPTATKPVRTTYVRRPASASTISSLRVTSGPSPSPQVRPATAGITGTLRKARTSRSVHGAGLSTEQPRIKCNEQRGNHTNAAAATFGIQSVSRTPLIEKDLSNARLSLRPGRVAEVGSLRGESSALEGGTAIALGGQPSCDRLGGSSPQSVGSQVRSKAWCCRCSTA